MDGRGQREGEIEGGRDGEKKGSVRGRKGGREAEGSRGKMEIHGKEYVLSRGADAPVCVGMARGIDKRDH